MTFRTLIRRSLRFHWRSHLGVVLGAAIGSAALIGALVVGDSVKGSLREQALLRLPNIWAAMSSGDRYFSDSLVGRMYAASTNRHPQATPLLPDATLMLGMPHDRADSLGQVMLQLPASISRIDGEHRANAVNLYGVDRDFVRHSRATGEASRLKADEVILNANLARQLDAQPGDDLLIRIPKATAFSQENAVARRDDSTLALRLKVSEVLPDHQGNLSLQSGNNFPLNAFVDREELATRAELQDRANLFLINPALRWRHSVLMERFRAAHSLSRHDGRPGPFRDFSWLRGRNSATGHPASSEETAALASELLAKAWTLADAQCDLKVSQSIQLSTSRIFLDPPVANAAHAANPNAQSILTYLATLLRAGTNATPYSMVTAAGAPWAPAALRDDEIVVSQWLADDLHVKPGDEIALSYFLPESGARLEEATNTFRVHSIVPMEMPWADRTLMPDFPGIEKAESTSEWDAGFPLTYKVRPKDDEYWKQYRGTPKAFITLAAGQKLWGNRFGNLTAIRFPIPTNMIPLTPALSPSEGEREKRSQPPDPATAGGTASSAPQNERRTNLVGTSSTSSQTSAKDGDAGERVPTSVEAYRSALEKKILANLKPEELGLRFEPVREQALKAAEGSQDFGGLFLGFSFFVIAAALLLMAMLFQFGLEQRAPEIGTLLALGFTPRQVRNLFLREGAMLALLGGILGAIGGIYFAKAMLHGLATIWRDAVGATALSFHVTGQTLMIGVLASVIVSTLTIWLALRKFVKRPARELLVGEMDDTRGGVRENAANPVTLSVKTISRVLTNTATIGVAALSAGVALVGWAMTTGNTSNAGIFFGAGALVLIAGLSLASAWLARGTGVAPVSDLNPAPENGDRRDACPTLGSLALRGCVRRRKRSLGTMAMLACGSFLIASISVFRLDANRDATQKTSGTGGFALIGETTMPVVQDLNAQSGRDFFALNERDLEGVSFVPFRVRAGDEASCLNLNAAQQPKLLGVKPEMLEGRFGFAKGEGWTALRGYARESVAQIKLEGDQPRAHERSHEIAAIGDANSIQWAMHKKVGDTIDYVDERGQPFKVRIVGAVANSILQGQLIIDEAEFVKRFPGESGYRMFLIDAPSNKVSEVSATLSRALQDVGLELTPAATRLNQFNAVQNTYLGTFQVLGGLGLLLGSVGLGIVVLRNVLERRSELAVLLAVGFRKAEVQRLVLMENGALLLAGLGIGVLAAAVAVLPSMLSPSGQLPYVSLSLTLAAVLLNGTLWTWVATRIAVRGDLLTALRNE